MESEEKYRDLVESTTDHIWEFDQDGCYMCISPAVKTLLGHEPQEIIGKAPFDGMLMSPAEGQRVANMFEQFITSTCTKTAGKSCWS